MSNCSFISYTKLSPNKTSPRNHKIDTISIHCMAGNLTIEKCGDLFASSSRSASSNYGVGTDGRIAMYVEEKDRSWCTSNRANDMRAVTIEVANDGNANTGWHVSDQAMAALIELVTDICRRNDIKELRWKADKSLIGQPDKQNMTVHRWFANKSCPGDYLYNKHSYIAAEVNSRLGIKNINNSVSAVHPISIKMKSDIKSIQTWLNTYYKTNLKIDGVFGTKTRAALIKAWQTEAGGLTVDGIFGTASKAKASSCNIKKGSRGVMVTIWQAFLVCKGYDPKGIDGAFGSGCHTSTIAFQRANNLSTDGIVGKKTWAKAFE
ncbi:MAG: N-acetylmuramoyl-L-alanine amidase [Acetatifactor sp.]|nr:N-acetylmuramoyl-L-alanine amidase [Acetatifactor sp.]